MEKKVCIYCKRITAIEIPSSRYCSSEMDSRLFECVSDECNKKFNGEELKIFEIREKMTAMSSKELQSVIENSLKKVEDCQKEWGKKHALKDWIGDFEAIKILHERIKRIEEKLEM